MRSIFCCGCFAFLFSSLTMPIFGAISRRLDAVSEVGGRHVGALPVGRLGGASMISSVVISIMLVLIFDTDMRRLVFDNLSQAIGIVIGLIVVSTVGFWDDLKRLPANVKFLAQTVAAIVVYSSGLRINGVDLPLLEPIQFGWLSLPVTMFWIVGIINAINLIDGLDGLAGGVIFFGAVVNLTAAIFSGSAMSAILMVAIVGAVLGFLIHNWHPAKIYMGDGGAYSLGFLIAISGLLAPIQKASTGIAITVSILAMGLPIFDTLFTVFRRLIRNKPLFSPDRGHVHHVLLDAGISHRRVVTGLYGFCLFFSSMALFFVFNRNPQVGVALILVSAIWLILWGILVRKQLNIIALKILKGN